MCVHSFHLFLLLRSLPNTRCRHHRPLRPPSLRFFLSPLAVWRVLRRFRLLRWTLRAFLLHLPLRRRLLFCGTGPSRTFYNGCGWKQRGLGRRPYKVAVFGRDEAIRKYVSLPLHSHLRSQLWTLSGARLVCHCTPNQACHADSVIKLFRQTVFDRDDPTAGPPSSETLGYLALLQTEPEEDEPHQTRESLRKRQVGKERKW